MPLTIQTEGEHDLLRCVVFSVTTRIKKRQHSPSKNETISFVYRNKLVVLRLHLRAAPSTGNDVASNGRSSFITLEIELQASKSW